MTKVRKCSHKRNEINDSELACAWLRLLNYLVFKLPDAHLSSLLTLVHPLQPLFEFRQTGGLLGKLLLQLFHLVLKHSADVGKTNTGSRSINITCSLELLRVEVVKVFNHKPSGNA